VGSGEWGGGRGEGGGGRGEGRGEGREVSSSARSRLCPRGRARVRVDASDLPPGNFITDATVRLSHGRPSGHRPTVRLSVCYRPRDNLGCESKVMALFL
jgi:hypothetical protein